MNVNPLYIAGLAARLDTERATLAATERRLQNYHRSLLALVAASPPDTGDAPTATDLARQVAQLQAQVQAWQLQVAQLTALLEKLPLATPPVPRPTGHARTAPRAPLPSVTATRYPPKPAALTLPATLCSASGLSKTMYQRDVLLLYLLGKTGRARRPWLFAGLAEYIDSLASGRSGSLSRLLRRLACALARSSRIL